MCITVCTPEHTEHIHQLFRNAVHSRHTYINFLSCTRVVMNFFAVQCTHDMRTSTFSPCSPTTCHTGTWTCLLFDEVVPAATFAKQGVAPGPAPVPDRDGPL